jgi:LPPG:FO 2-phospho-L-lactate transferase
LDPIIALCGGVGGAKLAYGLAQLLPPEELVMIVNTGDDFDHFGLRICPDIDTVMYTLSGNENTDLGWGRAEESWHALSELGRLGGETWFKLGDKDLALHLLRRQLLDQGASLTGAIRVLAARLGVRHPVLPMTDSTVRTVVQTREGELAFQEYFVHQRCEPRVSGFRFEGAQQAAPTPEIQAALAHPRGIIICPSNPYVSIGPILAIAGIREVLERTAAPILAVSPIVGGAAIKGPAAKMLAELGQEISAVGVARLYADLIDAMVIDEQDQALLAQRQSGDPKLVTTRTVMRTRDERVGLARDCLDFLRDLQ